MINQLNKINTDIQIISSSKNIKTDCNNSNNFMQYVLSFNNYKKCDYSGSNGMTV